MPYCHETWQAATDNFLDTPERQLQELCEKAKAHICAKVEYPFRILKQQLSLTKTRLRGLKKRQLRNWEQSQSSQTTSSECTWHASNETERG